MGKFLKMVFLFFVIVVAFLTLSLFFIRSKKSADSLLGAIPYKHELLANAGSPKIVLLGGSSVSFGFNSEKIEAAFHRPVVNSGVSIILGLKFMLTDIKPYINKGDLVVLAPEYHCFETKYIDNFEGDEGLLAAVFDTYPQGKSELDTKQWTNLVKFMPHYSASKFIDLFKKSEESSYSLNGVFGRNSFNKYGDAYVHWNKPNETITPEEPCSGDEVVNQEVITFLQQFDKFVTEKGAKLIILPQPIEAESYTNQKAIIEKIETALTSGGLNVIGDPSDYKMDRKYFFNYYSHLDKEGADIHTDQVIKTITPIVKKQEQK